MTCPFVTIDERMVLNERVPQRSSLVRQFRIEVLATEGHARLSQRRFQRAQVPDSCRPTGRLDDATMEFKHLP